MKVSNLARLRKVASISAILAANASVLLSSQHGIADEMGGMSKSDSNSSNMNQSDAQDSKMTHAHKQMQHKQMMKDHKNGMGNMNHQMPMDKSNSNSNGADQMAPEKDQKSPDKMNDM